MHLASYLERLNNKSGATKTGLVVGGYAAALLLSLCVVAIHVTLTSSPDRDLSSGMHAFGDGLLFVFSLGACSTVPTALALAFLRKHPGFWLALSAAAIGMAGTGLAAVFFIVSRGLNGTNSVWEALAVLRIFVAPLAAAFFCMSAWFAPRPRDRWCTIGAMGGECVTSAYGFVHWFLPVLLN